MLEESFSQVYTKFKLHFYQEIFSRFQNREASLTAVETFCMEIILALKEPTINEFASFVHISSPNAAYKVNNLIQKGYVEKGNKDEVFRYHIAKVVEDDYSLQEEPVITNRDFVLGIRPEAIDIVDGGNLEGEIYGAMPTGMESTIKVRVGDFLLTGVVFGSTLFTIGSKIHVDISGDNVMLFDRKSGQRIAVGSLEL